MLHLKCPPMNASSRKRRVLRLRVVWVETRSRRHRFETQPKNGPEKTLGPVSVSRRNLTPAGVRENRCGLERYALLVTLLLSPRGEVG